MLLSLGIASFSNSNHFLLKSGKSKNMPVTWPPGRERLASLALLWQIYSRRCLLQIHFRQCGHRCSGEPALVFPAVGEIEYHRVRLHAKKCSLGRRDRMETGLG